MKNLLNENKLNQIAELESANYQSNKPFPHVVIDNFLDKEVIERIHDDFPKPDQIDFYKYDNPLEKKLAMDQIAKLPESIGEILLNFNSPTFLNFLEKLTGIPGLIPDPYLRGGGIHQSVNQGKLDIHIDFNKHPKLNLERRLNVLLYLNKDWKEEYNGDFQLWKGHCRSNNEHVLESLEKRVYPIFNRFVVFSTSEKSYHGFPDRINCPDNVTRKSIALYYYTVDRPEEEKTTPHSTTYIKLPNEDNSLDALREQRNKGRLSSNIKIDYLK